MKTPLAWRNVSHNRVRSLIALCGISFAILLIFMQLALLQRREPQRDERVRRARLRRHRLTADPADLF
jgi:hypothetical protein